MEYNLDVEATLFVTEEDEYAQTPPLAMAYVPMQQWSCTYEDEHQALSHGTIFPCLYKPFLGGACPHA